MSLPIPGNPAAGGVGEDFLIGGDPFDADFGDGFQNALRDRTFRGPHAPRGLPESFLVKGHAPLQMPAGIFRVAVQMPGQRAIGHRLPGRGLVPQQRQDGMIKRRGREFDLARLRQLFVERNHLPEDRQLPIQQPGFFAFAPAFAFFAKLAEFGIVFKGQFVNPRQIAPALQIANVGLGKAGGGFFHRIDAAFEQKFLIPRIGADHAFRVGHETRRQKFLPVRRRSDCRRASGTNPNADRCRPGRCT